MVTATFNIVNNTLLHSKSTIEFIMYSPAASCSHMMSTNWSPPKTTNMAPKGELFASQQCPDENVGASDDIAGNTPSKDTEFGQPPNQFHPPPGYRDPPLQLPFPGTPQFYHHVPFIMGPCSQPSTGATQEYPSYGPSWQAYDFPQWGYDGPQLFPPPQFTGDGPTSPGAPETPAAPPRYNQVTRPTSSSSTAPGQLPGAPGRPPISLPMKQFLPAVEPRKTDEAGIAGLPPLQQISYDEYDADYESDSSSDFGGTEGKAPISLKQTEFSLKQFAKRMGKPNFSTFNKCKKVRVAGFLEKKHRSSIRGQNCLALLRHPPLHWETAVADCLVTSKATLPVKNVDNAGWIWRQWVELFLKKYASEIQEATKNGRWGNQRLAIDLGEPTGNKVRSNLPNLPITTFIVVIHWWPNGNNDQTSSMQLQASYANVRRWEELIDFIERNCGLKETYYLTMIYNCDLTQKELDEAYMRLCAPGQMKNDPLYGQISYNCSFSDAFKLKLGHNVKQFLGEMKAATQNDNGEHIFRPAKVIHASLVTNSFAPLLISRFGL